MIPTRERLLQSAVRLIWRNGYNAVSVDTICADAGANKGSFYHAYPSKAAILAKSIEWIWQQDRAQLTAIANRDENPIRRFEQHIDWFHANQVFLLEKYGFVPGHFHMAIDIQVPEAAQIAAASRKEYAGMLRAAVLAATDDTPAGAAMVDFIASTIERMIGGVMIEARLSNSIEPVATLKPLVMRLMETSLRAPIHW